MILQAAADSAPSAMVSIIGLDADKVAELCDAANAEVDEDERVQIANFLCPVCERNPRRQILPSRCCSGVLLGFTRSSCLLLVQAH
jgi:hypothetical protein